MNIDGYKVEIRPLSPRLGSGFVAFAPELVGCVSDGESRIIALLNLKDAMECWLEEARARGRPIPMI
jgi:predicted RNase H-like HicB family nuclease